MLVFPDSHNHATCFQNVGAASSLKGNLFFWVKGFRGPDRSHVWIERSLLCYPSMPLVIYLKEGVAWVMSTLIGPVAFYLIHRSGHSCPVRK